MIIKDYYKILEVTPSATAPVIKSAYRRLALKYHPDKNSGNKLYEQKFREINEAYRILSDTKKRNDYNYSRTGDRTRHSKPYTEPITVRTILLQAKKLRTKVASADPDRMNTKALYRQVEQLLSKHNLRLLKEAGDEKMNEAFVECIFDISQRLPYSNVQNIIQPLVIIAGTNNNLLLKIREFDKQIKYGSLWNEYKIFVALLGALLFCMLIYWISQ